MKKNRFKKGLTLLAVRPLMWMHTALSGDLSQHRQWNRRVREIQAGDRRLLTSGETGLATPSQESGAVADYRRRRGGGLMRTAVFGGLILATAMMTVDTFTPRVHFRPPPVVENNFLPNESASLPYVQPPKIAVEHAIQGYYHQINKQYAEALAEYDAALKLFPNYPDVHWNKALIYNLLQEYSQSVESYQQMLRVNPNDTDVLYNMGYALDKLGRYSEAVSVYDRLLKVDASDIHAPIGKGIAHYHLGDLDAAIADFVRVIDTNPKYAYYNLACMYSVKGEAAQALQFLDKALPYMDQEMMEWAKKDPDFASIRHMPEFNKLINMDMNE